MSLDHSRIPPRAVDELRTWINTGHFTHFVTLATNEPNLCGKLDALDRLIKRWDARMNRALVGPKWSRPDYTGLRIFAFYFVEKVTTNPHWHALIRTDRTDPEGYKIFNEHTEQKWKELMPKGSTDVQAIYDQEDVVSYVAKELRNPVSYAHFIVPDMFGAVR